MTTRAVLKRLLDVVKPGASLTHDTASHLAAELKRYAAVLESEPFQADLANRYPSKGKELPQKKKQKRGMDHSRYQTRYVALEMMYIGWAYHGFARQENTPDTVEGHMFQAMERTCLIPPDIAWEEISYSRCGRTDIGVSAAGQVVALLIRSKALLGEQLPPAAEELDYPLLLNKVLPKDIQITGWTDVPTDFHARFTADAREYKYFISGAQFLNLAAMRQAAQSLQGQHDFQNFCKMDLNNTMTHTRLVNSISLYPGAPIHGGSTPPLVLTVHGRAFLWHQVRCIAAVLIMVGKGQESPDITAQLLDVERLPNKPHYALASEHPLLLHRVGFGAGFEGLTFRVSERAAKELLHTMATHEARLAEEASLVGAIHERVRATCAAHVAAYTGVQYGHTALLRRAPEPSFVERLKVWESKGNSVKDRGSHMRVYATPGFP